jgi:hypothetical protein
VIFVCKDKREAVRARLAKREAIDLDDTVSVYLDTFHDRRRAYVFSVNPLGVQRDGIITEGQGDPDYNFDALWYSRGQLTPDGFVAWLAIPFKSLRFPSMAVQSWGIALGRSIVHSGEDSYWPYITNRVEGFVAQMATLEGLEQISTGRSVEFIPYGTFTRSRFLDSSALGFRSTDRARVGLDSKYVVNRAYTLDFTLNPDFSEVESDDPQVLVNQRFEVFFPEKRPFFIENAGFFQTPENLFYSRRIQDPEFGARLTGKTGGWGLGILASDDRAAGQQLPPADPGYGDRAVLGVLRIDREIGNESTIGILATARSLGSSVNDVLSMDMRLKLSSTWVFTGQAIRNFDRKPGGIRAQGGDYLAGLSHNSRHLTYTLSYLDRSPAFNALLGFIQRVDIRQASQYVGYYWRPSVGPVVAYGPSVTTSIDWSHKGQLQDWSGTADFAVYFRRASELKLTRAEYYELFRLQHLRQHSTSASFYSSPAPWFGISGSYQQGAEANYYPSASVVPFLANGRGASWGLTLRPSSRLRFDESYLYTGLATRPESTYAVSHALAILNNHVSRTKINYQLTRGLSLRAILDYNAVLPNPSLVAQQRTKRITPDLLLTYLLHPGTAFYIGYNASYENRELQPGPSPILTPSAFPGLLTGRQFFVKLTYAFRH